MQESTLLVAFVQWISAFSAISKPLKDLADLSDGIALFEICHDIDSKRFKLLQSADIGDNWVLKVNNLKKLYKLIACYYDEVLGRTIEVLGPINLNSIAREANLSELVKLCQLVLFMAMQSEDNLKYVEPVQNLNQEAQHAIMVMVESMQNQLTNAPLPPTEAETDVNDQGRIDEERLHLLEAELSRMGAEKQDTQKRLKQLTDANADYLSRCEELLVENKDIKSKLRDTERSLARVDQSGKADFLLKTEIDHLKQDLERAESKNHDSESLVNEQTQVIAELNRRLEDTLKAEEEVVRLRDQIQEYKHAAEKLQKTEHVIEKYKKKLEESSDYRRQLRQLEEHNTQLLSRNQAIEEEYRKVSQFKPLMDTYKDQIASLESKNNLLTLQTSELKHELKQTKDRLNTVEVDRQRDQEQINSLEDHLRELELTGASIMDTPTSPLATKASLDSALGDGNLFELKAKLARMESELVSARKSRGDATPSHKVVLLENLLEDAQRSKNQFENNYLQCHQKNLVLEDELRKLREAMDAGDASAAAAQSDLSLDLRARLNAADEELSRVRAKLAETQVQLDQTNQELTVAKSDLSMISADKRQALDALKSQTGAELEELKVQHEHLVSWYNELEGASKQKDEQISQLLREKDQLHQETMQTKNQLLEKERASSANLVLYVIILMYITYFRHFDMPSELRETLSSLQNVDRSKDSQGLEAQLAQLVKEKTQSQQAIIQHEIHNKKLRTVIANLEQSYKEAQSKTQDNEYKEAMESIKNALLIKTQEHDRLKREHEQHVYNSNREYRCILSAWQNLSQKLALYQQSSGPVTPHKPTSWMSHQRSALNIKLQRP
ncbi:hypothetical protein H4R33_004929 [Dimargaris cristalligena]|nr:hypothetical protein H4R33_004929 [Dimargaris cristalligena]